MASKTEREKLQTKKEEESSLSELELALKRFREARRRLQHEIK